MTPKTKKILIISGIIIAVIILLIVILKKKKSATTKTQNNGNGNGSGNGSQAAQTQPQQSTPQPQASQASQPAPFDSQNAAFLVLNGAMPQTMADAQTVLDNQGNASAAQIAAAEVIIGQTQQGFSNLFQS